MIKNFMMLPDILDEKEREYLQNILSSLEIYIGTYQFCDIGKFRYKASVVRNDDMLGNDNLCVKIFIAKHNSEKIILTYTFDRDFFIEEIKEYLESLANDCIENRLHKFIDSLNELINKYNINKSNLRDISIINDIDSLVIKYNLRGMFKITIFRNYKNKIISIAVVPLNKTAATIGKDYLKKKGLK